MIKIQNLTYSFNPDLLLYAVVKELNEQKFIYRLKFRTAIQSISKTTICYASSRQV